MTPSDERVEKLFFEDFRAFPPGALPFDYTPIREFHFFMPETGRWYEATLHGRWRATSKGNPKERWQIVDEDGEAAVEQVTLYEGVPPMLVAGDPAWTEYTLSVQVRPLNPDGRAGVLFLYQTNMDHYAFTMTGDAVRLERVNYGGMNPEVTVLAEAPWTRDCDRRATLSVEIRGGRAVATATSAAGEAARIECTVEPGRSGRVGLFAENPARFYNVAVTATPEEKRVWVQTRAKAARELDEARARYPVPRLVKVIDTPGFGVGKTMRFGDLTGDGRLEIVIAQNQPRVAADTYGMISCITALTLDGEILWQRGRPSPKHALVTNDMPLQIYDIDGDGAAEVLCTQDFRILILDGRTGTVKLAAPTPKPVPLPGPLASRSEDALYRIVGDAIHICNVRGLERPRDILLKDRYNNVWVYDDRLNLLWSAQAHSTGHFPFSYDFDGDGRDEVLVGYTLFSADGRKLWSLDHLVQHADGLGVIPREDGSVEIVIAGGDDGVLFVTPEGTVLYHDHAGHVQTANSGNFRPDLPGLEYTTITYHRYPGVLSIFDAGRRLIHRSEPLPVGSHIKPVNWTGLGDELILFSGSARGPGLLDGYGRSVVNLPDDGHPDLCCEPVDLLGDPRDEIVVWDPERIFIYTQDEPFRGERIYTPRRPPHYNYSNYRCEISLPGWSALNS